MNMSCRSAKRQRTKVFRATGTLIDLPNLDRSDTQREIIIHRKKKLPNLQPLKPYVRYDDSNRNKSVIFKAYINR